MNRFSVLALMTVCMAPAMAAPGADWYQSPFRIQSGERLLDTFDNDPGGHAAPFLADIDADGRRDLTVGSIQGRFHFYRNIGADAQPRFAERSSWLMAGASANEPARVPNFCCVASGPQMVDIDGDGILDLTSGSYSPAQVYWFKGRGDGTFHARHIVTDLQGRPVLPVPEQNPYEVILDNNGNVMTNVAWMDWDNNGHLDIILGNARGRLYLWMNAQDVYSPSSFTSRPIASQPQFFQKRSRQAPYTRESEILIGGEAAIPEGHAAPAVADWDGDGLWDILVGSNSGRVYWLRNSGKPGAPGFKERVELLGPGKDAHWVEPGDAPGRGIRSQIHAVDYNLDGKLDLLVGEWSMVQAPRPDLSARERKRMQAVRRELDELDARAGFKAAVIVRYKMPFYQQNKDLLTRAQTLETELTRYLGRYSHDEKPDYMRFLSYQKYTGHVWVFLRK